MKSINKYLMLLPSVIIFASIAMAESRSENPEDYKVVLLDDCKVVSEKPMTQKQLDAYLPLYDSEKLMEDLHKPLEDMEDKLKEFTDQIEEITELAIHDDDDSLYIDKAFIREQVKLASKIGSIVELHQVDIDAIEDHGRDIGQKAKVFERAIKVGIEDIDYDQIRIVKPNGNNYYDNCR